MALFTKHFKTPLTPAWQVLALLSLFFIMVSSLSSCESNPSNHSTLVLNGTDSGFGGTGKMAVASNNLKGSAGDGLGGFGGTGKSSSGFGGTGIVGTITEFGSIWVNGIEIGYGQQTRVTSRLHAQETLKLGQQVVLETLPLADKTLTQQVTVFYPMAGKITGKGRDYLELNQQYRVKLTAETFKDKGIGLNVGDYVAVNAYQIQAKEWVATRLNHNTEHQSFYQPVPKLDFSDKVNRLIIEAGMMQFSHWSFGKDMQVMQQGVKRSGERMIMEITTHHGQDKVEMIRPYSENLQWQGESIKSQTELKDASELLHQQREKHEMLQEQKEMMEMKDIHQQQKEMMEMKDIHQQQNEMMEMHNLQQQQKEQVDLQRQQIEEQQNMKTIEH